MRSGFSAGYVFRGSVFSPVQGPDPGLGPDFRRYPTLRTDNTTKRFVVLKIETRTAHRILIRQLNFESLANEILFSKEDLPQSVKENMRHEKAYNEIARERYHNVMCFYLYRDVQLLREAGFVIQPHLPWIVATPDGLISDASNNNDAIEFSEKYVQGHCEIVILKTFYLTLISLLKKTRKY